MESDGDVIVNLPEPIIHRIFSFLETIDAIRASAVCQKWRYIWVSLPYLSFNVHTVWKDPQSRWPLQTINDKFKDFVNWVLAFQDRNCGIQRFRLSYIHFPGDYAIQRWMTIVASRNAKAIELYLLSRSPFRFPSCFLTCKSLVALNLSFLEGCVVQLPSTGGFSHLKRLGLEFVRFQHEGMFRRFIFACPLLEKLWLSHCTFDGFKNFDICSASLKELIIWQADDLLKSVITIACQSLESLKYRGPLPQNFLLQNLSSLDNALIDIKPTDSFLNEKHASVASEALKGLKKARFLKLNLTIVECLQGGTVKTNLSDLTTFCCLKFLWLYMWLVGHFLEFLIDFLKCSPHLEALTIEFEEGCELMGDWEIPDETTTCLTYHLKTVQVLNVVGNKNEIELIRFLLKNGQVLEKMRIIWSTEAENPNQSIQKITSFPASSPSVSLKFY